MTLSDNSACELAARLAISPQAIEEAVRRGLLSFVKHRNFRCWRFGDRANGTTRALNGKKFVRSDKKGADWHKLIGLADVIEHDRRFVIFVLEGSTDALAAFELAHRAGLLCQAGIVMALGAGYRPIMTELRQLSGRKVLLIGDRDDAGVTAVRRVSCALTELDVDHAVWNWNAFDSSVGKDLFDLVKADGQEKKIFDMKRLTFFSFFSPSYGSTVQQFNSSTHAGNFVLNRGFNGSTHIQELVDPFVVKKRGTGNALSFALARALRAYEVTSKALLMETEIDEVFHYWFTKSQPLLPPHADEEKSLAHFYKQIRRVRYLPCALDAALKRASTLPLPDIPDLNTNELKVAALMRELQRDAGEKCFICPVNVIVGFVPLRFAEQARRILFVLEQTGVIECVQRGAPHMPGKPGKSSIWHYKRSINE
jgi:hypothetical protein